ncbi:monothiol glutaredoxin-S15 [Haematococcus lacustris]
MLPAALKLALCGSGAQRHGARVASRWYTTLDADTHDDFKPKITSNAVPTDAADVIKNDISSSDVFLYMKGVPKQPQCGFSNNVVRLLDAYGVQYGSRNVLADPSIREGVKKFSNWPTIPQVYVKGEFVGGADILWSMHESGELEKLLEPIVAKQQQAGHK